jgi:hypothetical protein
MSFFLLLLFSPASVRSLSGVFNRSVDIDRKLSFLDKSVRTEELFYAHPVAFGACLVVGSLFALVFFFFKLDISHFSRVVFGTAHASVGVEILFDFLAWIGKLACLLGLGLGMALLIAPQKLRRWEGALNNWFETRPLVDRLQKPRTGFDSLLFSHPVLFGVIGGAVSCLLIVLSVLNLLR